MVGTRRSKRISDNAAKEEPKEKPAPKKKAAPPKKAAATKAKTKTKPAAAKTKTKPAPKTSSSSGKKTIVIVEACKQWGAFKTRANKIAKAVGDRALVEINKEKPGKGNFVVTIAGSDEPIVSLLGMKRPFPALKALDMDEINGKILKALE